MLQHFQKNILITSIEVPITDEKPKYYQVNDNFTLIHNVAHTYSLELTDPTAPSYNELTKTDNISSDSYFFYIKFV